MPATPGSPISTIIMDVVTDAPEVLAAVQGVEAAIAAYGAIPAGTKKISDILKLNIAISTAISPLGDAIQSQAGLTL